MHSAYLKALGSKLTTANAILVILVMEDYAPVSQ